MRSDRFLNASIAMKTATLALVLVASNALAGEHAPEPTAFEKFITDPNVLVDFEHWIGSLVSGDAKANVSVLAAHDTADPAKRMRGLRLTMEDNAGSDSVHLDESQFAALKDDLASVESLQASMRKESGAPYLVAGTASCWMPERPIRILCTSYRIGPDWTGLLLAAYGGRVFEFPGRSTVELATLIDQAQAALPGP
jgi:hypothetical protein